MGVLMPPSCACSAQSTETTAMEQQSTNVYLIGLFCCLIPIGWPFQRNACVCTCVCGETAVILHSGSI